MFSHTVCTLLVATVRIIGIVGNPVLIGTRCLCTSIAMAVSVVVKLGAEIASSSHVLSLLLMLGLIVSHNVANEPHLGWSSTLVVCAYDVIGRCVHGVEIDVLCWATMHSRHTHSVFTSPHCVLGCQCHFSAYSFHTFSNAVKIVKNEKNINNNNSINCYCLLYTSPSPRDRQKSRMPSSA